MRRTIIALTLFFGITLSSIANAALEGGLEKPFPAPDIVTQGAWINSAPLTSADLKGKVVLVDFWTYSCINCLRTFPYIKAWHEQYKDKGLVIIGVHTPEFDFEKDKANVQKAVSRFKLTYPIVQDNDHTIWNRFNNKYWPAHYLINKDGQVVYTHFGEGKYDVTEKNIRALLDEKGDMAKVSEPAGSVALQQTHETYLGTARAERFEKKPKVAQTWPSHGTYFEIPEKLEADHWGLRGEWNRTKEFSVTSRAKSALRMHFRAGKVFLVLGTKDAKPITASILYNGKPAIDVAGKDVKDGKVTVTEHRLYELIDLKKNGQGVFEIISDKPGLQAYAFTFGGV